MQNEEEKNPIQVADRLFLAIEQLADHGPMGLMELAQALELHKSTMHRVLNSLIYMGYVKQDEASLKYSLTFKLVRMANQILSRVDILEELRPHLKNIVDLTGETVHLVQREGNDAVYLMKIESEQNHMRMVSRVGSRIPMYCSGVGKAMAAELSRQERQGLWENSTIRRWTSTTITDYENFEQEMTLIRKNGYAVDHEENEVGVCCVAVSLPDYYGHTGYAVSITGPANRMTEKDILHYSKLLLEMRSRMTGNIHS